MPSIRCPPLRPPHRLPGPITCSRGAKGRVAGEGCRSLPELPLLLGGSRTRVTSWSSAPVQFSRRLPCDGLSLVTVRCRGPCGLGAGALFVQCDVLVVTHSRKADCASLGGRGKEGAGGPALRCRLGSLPSPRVQACRHALQCAAGTGSL